MMKSIFICSLLFLFTIGLINNLVVVVEADSSSDYALSSVSLLLPYSANKFRKPIKLESNKGCFEWSTSNPDLIEIIPIYDSDTKSCNVDGESGNLSDLSAWDQSIMDSSSSNQQKCSKSINILVRNPGSLTNAERNSAFIYAEEKATNRVLQCEVFVDKISSIVIETTTKTMYKDDVEELHVRAYDSVGNVFSSIVGLEFEWTIASGNVIQIVPFRGFLRDELALKMEQEGLQTSFVLVQGVDTGRTQINTKLTDLYYKEIHHSTTISILEPLQLNPNYLLYVIPGTQIPYQLLTKKRNALENIKLPNQNYLWSSSNKQVGIIEDSGLFMAIDYGKTELKVQHANMSDNKVQSFVNVVKANYLSFKIEPLKSLGPGPVANWNLIQSKNYVLIVELYDAAGHKIYNSDISYDITIPKEYFEPLPLSEQPPQSQKRSDSSYYLKAIKQGTTTIKASLSKVYDWKKRATIELLNPIQVEQQLNIHPEILVSPPIVYLPFIPKFKQTHPLRPSGGSGDYSWFTNNSAIAGVDSNGVISSNFQPGQTEIIIVDKKNPHNRASMIVFLLEPNQISIEALPSNQIELGKFIQLNLKLKSNQIPKDLNHDFDKHQLPLSLPWKVDDEKIFKQQLDSPNQFQSLREGSSLVSIEFLGMKSNIRLFSFENLKVDNDYLLMTLGTSKTITFTGGPEPWYLDSKLYYQQIQSSTDGLGKNQIQISPITSNSFTVTCLQHFSNGILSLSVGNKQSSTYQNPIVQTIEIPYTCSLPKSIQIQLQNQQPTGVDQDSELKSNECHSSSNTGVDSVVSGGDIKIRNRRTVGLEVLAFDESGKRYNNHSTLIYDWSVSDENKAGLITKEKIDRVDIKLYDKEGKLTIHVKSDSYHSEILRSLRITPAKISTPLKSHFDLFLISTVKLDPESKLLYLASNNHLTLKAIGGSKNFKFSTNNTKVADTISQTKDSIKLQPMLPGYIKVLVEDLCGQQQDSEQQDSAILNQVTSRFSSNIQISDVHSIELSVLNLVQVGNSIELLIKAYSMSGDEFDSSQYQFMNILTKIDNPSILSVSPSLESSQIFQLKGLDQGLVNLQVQITNQITNQTILSKTVLIQVYPPFKLSLRTLHLVPNGHYQIHWSGGSTMRQEVDFESHDSSVASFSTGNKGELKALKVGETIVTANAYIIDQNTNKKIQIGTDRLTVIVKNMNGIHIHCSIDKVLVGNEAKLRVVGENGETPFTYGTVDLYFKWESLDSNVAALAPIYQQFNTSVEMEGSFTIRVLGMNPGKTTVTVWAYSSAQISRESPSNFIFQSKSFQITVLPIIPIPTSTLLLPLNAISNHPYSMVPNVRYQTLEGDNCDEIIKIQHSPNTKISTLDKIGTCLISVRRDNHMDTSKLLLLNTKPFSHLEVLPIVQSDSPSLSQANRNTHHRQSMVLSIGDTMSFKCYLRDDIGELFSEYANVANLGMESSISGIIGVTMDINSNFTTLNVKGIRPGVVTLHVYLKDQPHLDDYIKIFVGKLIEPYAPILHLGSVVRFNYQNKDQKSLSISGDGSKWESSDSNVISINSESGKSKSNSIGSAFIHYIQTPSSSTPVSISKVSDILMESPSAINDNVAGSSSKKEFKYLLKILNSDLLEFTHHPSIDQGIKGSCSIKNHPNFASTRFEFINSTGEYYCIVKPTGGQDSLIDKLELLVQVYNQEKTYLFEKSFPLTFESSFSILNAPSNRIQLNPSQKEFKLVVQSTKEVFFDTESKYLSIQPYQDIDTATHQGRFKFLIQPMRPNEYFNDEAISISVIDSNNQKKNQVIFVSHIKESSSILWYFFVSIIFAVGCVSIYFGLSYLSDNSPKTKQERSSFSTTNSSSNNNFINSQYGQSTFNNSSSFNPTNSNFNNSMNQSQHRFTESFPSPFRTPPPQQRHSMHLRESIYKSPQ